MKLNKLHLGAASLAMLATAGVTAPANAGIEPYIGEIYWVGSNFCPRGTADASGQILSIAQNTALFSLLGTTYGGNGQTTFALPDLRGRVSLHTGQGPGLTPRTQGELAGTETNTMTLNQMPAHTHTATSSSNSSSTTTLRASSATANTASPAGNVLADGRTARVYRDGTANVDMDASSMVSTGTTTSTTTTVANAGGGQPQNNVQPYLTLRACIVLEGIFPSRP